MIALQIEHVGNFMKKLLLQETFDDFLVSEASVTTFVTFSIDGQLHPEFYTSEDNSPATDHQTQSSWKNIRPFCLSVIRGQRLPLSFHFVFMLSDQKLAELIEDNGLDIAPADIFGVYLNLQYRNETLTLTTGSSVRDFTKGKPLDQSWDRMLQEFLKIEDLS